MASITVDIKAQITGYQEQINKMKKELANVDLGSSIGKSLQRSIDTAQKQLNALSKTPMPKLSSESGIESLTNKLVNVNEIIQNIGQEMQKVTFGDLNLDALHKATTELVAELNNARQQLSQNVDLGFQDAIKSVPELSNLFKQMGQDINALSAEQGKNALAQYAEETKQKAEEAAAALSQLKSEQQALQSEVESKKAPDSFISRLQTSLQQLSTQKVDVDQVLNTDVIKQTVDKWIAQIDRLTGSSVTNEAGTQLKDIVTSYFDLNNLQLEADPDAIRAYVTNFINEFSNAFKLLGGQGGQSTLKTIFGEQLDPGKIMKNFLQVDPQEIETIRNNLRSIFKDFSSEEVTGKDTKNFFKFVNEDQLEKALNEAVNIIKEKLQKAQEELQKQEEELNRKNTEVVTATTTESQARTLAASTSDASIKVNDIIQKLQTENQELSRRVATLETKLQERAEQTLTGIHNIGNTASNTAKSELPELAKNAQLYKTELDQVLEKEKLVGKIEGVVQRWFSIYAAVRMVGNAIRSVISTIQELDKTITEIAIVTDMTQQELWGQMSSYTDMARQYASSISGVYQVSQLYYQQGLQTADVMALTEQTLKMARISGLGYAEATDFMTNAIRSFKMEMTDAQRVVDVYSAVAASSATSTTELANAMSKTASSAESVGSSFENTTAMMAVMIEATRESAENIGSAMKSIISRYGEMTSDPTKVVDSEGQEMSLNRVDKALQTVGISIHDAAGQFRDFDDVITELAGKWDTIDANTQRYIATIMAGNRQQSRFLALVSNGERLAELSEEAANSQDAATLQVLKTMDSIEAKTQQFKTSLQSLYVDAGIENLYKSVLDIGNNIVKTFTGIAQTMNTPIAAIAKFGAQFVSLANLVTTVFGLIKARVSAQQAALNGQERRGSQERVSIAQQELAQKQVIFLQEQIAREKANQGSTQREREESQERIRIAEEELAKKQELANMPVGTSTKGGRGGVTKTAARVGMVANLVGSAASLAAANMGESTQTQRAGKAWLTGVGSVAQGIGIGSMFGTTGMAVGAGIGAIAGAIEAVGIATESTEEKIKNLNNTIEETSNKKLQSKDELKTLIDYQNKYQELSKVRDQDAESRKEWINLNNEIAANYPELIKSMNMEGNYVVDMTNAYRQLAEAKFSAYKNDFLSNMSAELGGLNDLNYIFSNVYNLNSIKSLVKFSVGPNPDQTQKRVEQLIQGQNVEKLSLPEITNIFGNGFTVDTGSGERLDRRYQSNTFVEILNRFNELAQENYTLADAQKQISNEFSEQYETAIDNFNNSVYELLLAGNDALTFQSDLIQNKINSGNQEWLNVITGLYDLEPSSIQNALALQELNKEWEKYYSENQDKLHKDFYDSEKNEYREFTEGDLYNEFIQQYQGAWLNKFINDTKQFEDEALNSLYNDSGKYSRIQYSSLLQKQGLIGDNLTEILALYDKQYQQAIDDFQKSILNNFDEGTPEYYKGLVLSNIIPPEFIDSIASKIQNIFNNNNLSDDIKLEQFNGIANIIDSIDSLSDETQKIAAFGALNSADLTSLSGVYNFINSLKEVNVDLDQTGLMNAITTFGETLSINLTTEFDSFAQSIISKTEDFEKALSNASKGMDLKTASEMADKLSLSLDQDFDFRDGKFFLNNAIQITEGYLKFNEDLKAALDEEKTQITTAIENFDLSSIFGEATDLLTNGWVENIEEGINWALGNSWELEEGKYPEDTELLLQIYRNYYQQAIAVGKDINTYIAEQLADDESKLAIVQEATNYAQNVSLIEAGQLELFLTNINEAKNKNWTDEEFTAIMDAINSGDLQSVTDEDIMAYATALSKTYQNVEKSMFDTAIGTISGQAQMVQVTPVNKEFLKKYGIKQNGEKFGKFEWPEDGSYVWLDFTLDNIEDLRNNIVNDLQNNKLTQDEASSLLKTLHDEEYKNNIYDALSGIADTYDNISYEAAQALVDALGLDSSVESSGLFNIDNVGKISIGIETLRDKIIESWAKGLISNEQYNKIRASLEEQSSKLDTNNIINSIISKRDQITAEGIGQLATALDTTYGNIRSMLQSNDDGTYTMSIATLWNNFKDRMNDATRQYVAGQIDNVISSITGLSGSQSKGFTNLAEMQKYISELNKLGVTTAGGEALDFRTLFEYDNTLHAYRLSTQGLIAQIGGMQSQLAELTGEEKEIAEQLIADTTRQFAEQIDAESVIDAIGTNQISLARTNFRKAVEDYNSVLTAMAEVGESVELLDAEALLNNLHAGGLQAVEAMTEIARIQGQKITADQAESAYRSKVSQYIDAIDQLVAKPGEIVDQTTADIIAAAGGQVAQLSSSGSYLVQSAANLYQAYKDLLEKMRDTGEATLADLNKVAGAMLDNKDGEQQVIDALGDAAGLTYSRFGEILTTAGYRLTEELVQQLESSGVIQALGGNKMRITNFAAFADLMNWDADSEEYVSAFKTYNDSLIEINRQAEKNILEEAQNVASAKGGDWVNLTQLVNAINEEFSRYGYGLQKALEPRGETPFDNLQKQLMQYGAYIDGSILKIADNADMLGIINTIKQTVESSGGLITSELAELADAIAEAIANYASLISSGIKGNLNNQQANELKNFASNYGIEQIDFHETAEGLKLSQQSAIELYNAISKIDALQGQLVFNELRSSLEKSNAGLANISATSATIVRIQKEMQSNAAKIVELEQKGEDSTKIDKIKNENRELKNQLDLYNKLAVAQSSDPNSFDFMNRKMPDSFNGPKNYWDSIGEAYSAMNQAASSGKMGIQDFYNIVNEMSNLAQMSGQAIDFMGYSINGDLTNASKLIQAGFNALSNVDGKGVKIDMGKLAANLQTGADDMGKGFDKAIRSMAKSQIAMLDSMINILEAIVAMEELGDLDDNQDNTLDIGELFTINDEGLAVYNEDAQEVMNHIKEAAEKNPEIQAAFESLFLGQHNLWEYITDEGNVINEIGVEGRKALAEVFTQMMRLAQSDEFDLDNIQESIMNLLQSSGLSDLLNGVYYDKEAKLSYVMTPNLTAKVDWEQWDETALQEIGIESQEKAQELLKKYAAGEEITEAELVSILKLTNQIEVETDENDNETGNYLFNGASIPKDDLPRVIAETNKVGADLKSLDYDLKTGTITFNQEVKPFINVKVTDKNGEKEFEMPDGSTISGGTLEEAYSKWYEANKVDENGTVYNTEQEFTEHIQALLNPEVSYVQGKISGDENALAEIVKMSHTTLQNLIDKAQLSNIDGKYHLTLPSGNDFAFDSKENIDATVLGEAAAEALNIPSVIASVAEGIRTAFEGESGTAIGEAIGEGISLAISNAGKSDNGEPVEVPEDAIPTMTLPALKVDVTDLTIGSVTNPNFSAVEEGTSNFTIGTASATITNFNIDKIETPVLTNDNSEVSDITLPNATGDITDLNIKNITKSHYDSTLKLSEDIATGEANVTNMAVGATNFTATGSLLSLQGMNFSTTSTSLSNIASATNKIGKTSFSNFNDLSGKLSVIQKQVDTIWSTIQQFANQTFTVNMNTNNTTSGGSGDSGGGKSGGSNFSSVGDFGLSKILGGVASAIGSIFNFGKNSAGVLTPVAGALKIISQNQRSSTVLSTIGSYLKTISTSNAGTKVGTLASAMTKINSSNAAGKISNLASALSRIPESKSMSVRLSYSTTRSSAKGNIGDFAQAKGTFDALARGRKTLMGELGPELVVSNGQYFVVGQNGAEFVDLAKDAIVFNHKQTKRLLEQGMIGSRGKPITNEANAISYAKGNISDYGAAKKSGGVIPKILKPGERQATTGKVDTITGEEMSKPQNKVQKVLNTALAASEKISSVKPVPTFHEFKLFSYAKGNIGGIPHSAIRGPAMASASSILAALKQLRAMWQSILNASPKDLGGLAGKGGGGGGGGGGGKDKNWQPKSVTADIQRWYNLLRQIAKLEHEIALSEKQQSRYETDRFINGDKIYQQQKSRLAMIDKEIIAQKELILLQKSFLENQRYQMEHDPVISKIFSFQDGVLQYAGSGAPGSGMGLDILEHLNRLDEYGRPTADAKTANTQYAYLEKTLGKDLTRFKYRDDGTEILLTDDDGKKLKGEELNSAYAEIIQNFFDYVAGAMEEYDSLQESIWQTELDIEDNEIEHNKILKAIVDNQLEVENAVLQAIEDREQAIIDELQDERDALEKSSEKFINGLTEALNKEQQMYQQQDERKELTKLQRQLNILQRSGGSASQIRTLQDQINSKQRDMYFNEQQRQIDAIQEASNKEIERLDAQLELMNETLEYEKEHGLLWNEVYQVMSGNQEEILNFIKENSAEYASKSAADLNETLLDIGDKVSAWIAYREDANAGTDPISQEPGRQAYLDSQVNNPVGPQDRDGTEGEDVSDGINNKAKLIKDLEYYTTAVKKRSRERRDKYSQAAGSEFEVIGVSKNKIFENLEGEKKYLLKVLMNGKERYMPYFPSYWEAGLLDRLIKNGIPRFAEGGLIDYTGLAWVDGTKTKPETVLSADQTSQLRKSLFNSDMLIRSLSQITASWENLRNEIVSGNYNTETIIIEKAEVNMNVNSIANDYDARRAGDMALDEMVKIARKYGARGVKRR